MTITLFGEAVGGHFDRGVGQYPTVGDEVHLVTSRDLEIIYGEPEGGGSDSIVVGRIASSAGIPARLQLSKLVSRHSCVVGSTGAGKSNFVAVVLEELCSDRFPTARTLVIDPHGEYASAVGDSATVIHTGVAIPSDARHLRVPYWALPFDELLDLALGDMQPHAAEALRDRVAAMKRKGALHLADPPPQEAITADTPVPFSIRQLWFELEHDQRVTYEKSEPQNDETKCKPEDNGDPVTLRPPSYPPISLGSKAPYLAKRRLPIGRQLDLLHSRLRDARFAFMFDPDDPLHPDLDGKVSADLDSLLVEWIGGPQPMTVLDVSGLPPEVLGTVVGTMLRLIYDALFWAMELPVGGRRQPLLVVLDEAHRFLPYEGDTPAHAVISRIAKEGRKYGVGLMVVTQRPSDVDPVVLSQCGTMIALRVTNSKDRSAVSSMIPDDLGDLTELLPSLRTGETLALGEALQIPSRIRIRKARSKPVGEDAALPDAWRSEERPDPAMYSAAVKNWRAQSTSATTTVQPRKDDP
ncbi:MAG: ATP-binding protein [Solirubrobacteraceae bacterium]